MSKPFVRGDRVQLVQSMTDTDTWRNLGGQTLIVVDLYREKHELYNVYATNGTALFRFFDYELRKV